MRKDYLLTLAEFSRLIKTDERVVKQMVIKNCWSWTKSYMTDSGQYVYFIPIKGFENEFGVIEPEKRYTMTLAELSRLLGKSELVVKQMILKNSWPWAKYYRPEEAGKHIYIISIKGFENEYGNIESES